MMNQQILAQKLVDNIIQPQWNEKLIKSEGKILSITTPVHTLVCNGVAVYTQWSGHTLREQQTVKL